MNILVVEDEKRLAEALGHILRRQGYNVDVVSDGQTGYDYASTIDYYDILILDVMLPKLDGFEIVRRLRKESISTPILMLTARAQLADKIEGLDRGADDYMTKPFQPEELLARVRALTRRQGEVVVDLLKFDHLELTLDTCDLACQDKSVHLSYKEFEVMQMLMTNPGQTISKEQLISRVWGVESAAEDNNVEAYISFLRKKLAFLNSNVEIVTLRKIGYRLEVRPT
jgi:two-component system, OmpR family, response regulator